MNYFQKDVNPFFSILFVLLLFSTQLWADSAPPSIVSPSVEFKTGYFIFADRTLRTIYNHGGLDFQLAATYPTYCWKDKICVCIYGSAEYFKRSGYSSYFLQKTSLWQIPINLGLKPVFALCEEILYYFTAGPRYFYIYQHNRSPYVTKKLSKNGLGIFVNTGFNFILKKRLLIDLFAEYSYLPTHFNPSQPSIYSHSVQVGGFTFGGGFGYVF